jgi:O-antigen/teichoic acid export membrane protein
MATGRTACGGQEAVRKSVFVSVARHSTYNIAGAVIPIGISLVLTPVLIHFVGIARYGLLSIYLILLGYFGFFNFGTGRAVAQRIASLRHGSQHLRNQAFWTSLSMSLVFCVVAAIVVAAGLPLIVRFLGVDGELAAELRTALYWLIAAVPMVMLGSQFSGALEGSERFGFVNLVSVLTSAASLALPLAAAIFIAPTLQVLAAAATLGRLLGVVALGAGATVLLPVGRPSFDRNDAGKLLSFGGWITISNVIGPILSTFDRFLIGRLIGASATGIYALPFSLMIQMQLVPAAVNRALFPRMAAASAIGAPDGSEDTIALFNFAITCILVVASPLILPFFWLWVGPETGTVSSPVAYALMPGIWANSLAMVTSTALVARANTRFLALVHLSEIVPFLLLLYGAVHFFGIVGAGLAWSLRCAVDAAIILGWQRVPLQKLPTALSGIGISAISAISLLLPPGDPLRWILLAVIGALTLWQAWVWRPPLVRAYETRFYMALRRRSWSR